MSNESESERTPLERLQEDIEATVEEWDRESPIAGEIVSLNEGDNEYGTFVIVTLRAKGGALVEVPGFGSVLNNAFRGADLRVGDLLGVQPLAKKVSGSGREYANFRVMHQPAPCGPGGTPRPATPPEPDPF